MTAITIRNRVSLQVGMDLLWPLSTESIELDVLGRVVRGG